MNYRSFGSSLAGPAFIAASVAALLHGTLVGGNIANGDLPTFWLPTFCFLGENLASGHIPAWNPYVMGGVPFAADPQSGWMYLPAMALFTGLPCDVAIRWMVVLQPVLAGWGIYWFLRAEGAGRPSATMGGLVLGIGIAGSQLTNSLPLAGALAWSSLSLAACSRYLHARTRAARFLWAGLTALAWGQLAAAHFSVGMLMGTGLLVIYGTAKLVDREFLARAGARRAVLLRVAVLPVLFVVVNLGYLLPRLAYLPDTSLALGYAKLERLGAELSGFSVDRPIPASTPEWPLKLAAARGAHPGALALGLTFVPLISKRFRPIAMGLSVYGLLLYILTLRSVASWVERTGLSWRPADTYVHSPEWWGYGLLIVVAVLAGLGLEAWLRAESKGPALWAIGLAVLVWGVLPPIFGAPWFELSFTWAGAAVAAAVVSISVTRSRAVLLAPIAVAVEMVASALIGYRPPPFWPIPKLLVDRAEPTIDTASFVRPGPVVLALKAQESPGRYVAQNLGGWERLQADPRSPIFGVEHVQGYNPVQLRRYWMLVRKVSALPLPYNLSLFHDPPPAVMDLLHVRYVVSGLPYTSSAARVVARPGRLGIYEVTGAATRASAVTDWMVVRNQGDALRAVTQARFDPSRQVVLEEGSHGPGPPGSGATPAPGERANASYVTVGPQEAIVRVTSNTASVLVVRIPFENNWKATIDGRPATVVPADFVIQAVRVPAGSHTVRLTYDDPLIGMGLAGTVSSLGALVLAAAVARTRERRV